MSLPAKIIGILSGVFGIRRETVNTIIQPGTAGAMIVRQPGGTAGTDEVKISHDGTNALLQNMNAAGGKFAFEGNGGGGATVGIGGSNPNNGAWRVGGGGVLEAIKYDESAYVGINAAQIACNAGTAIPAAGATTAGLLMSSTASFGVFFGSGAPTLSAAKGSLYLRSDGSGTNDRLYVATNSSGTWTAVVTVA